MNPLSPQQLADFEQDGFVIVRDLLPKDLLDDVRAVFAGVVDDLARQWRDEGFITDTGDDLPFETRFIRLREQLPPKFATSWRSILVSPTVFSLWQRPELLGPIRSLLGDEIYAHGVWNGRPREPGNSIQKVYWHQDAHYYRGWDPADGKLISVWMPLVDATADAGCLEFLRGSHRGGLVPASRSSANNLFTVADEIVEQYETAVAECRPGDAIFFGDTTIHQSRDNVADYVRWSIDIRFGEASEGIISKTPRGYHCFSASNPGRVEDYETWVDRYDYSKVGVGAEIGDGDVGPVDYDAVAQLLNVPASELRAF